MVIISFAPSWGGYASILRVGRRLSRGDGSLSLSLSLSLSRGDGDGYKKQQQEWQNGLFLSHAPRLLIVYGVYILK